MAWFTLCWVKWSSVRLALAAAAASITATALSTASSSTDSRRLYLLQNFPNRIVRTNLDGSNQEVLLNGLGHPQALAVDDVNDKLYWSVSDDDSDRIVRSNLDGSQIEDLVVGPHTAGIAVDAVHGFLYWTDMNGLRIQRCKLDGSDVTDLVTGLHEPAGLDLDVNAGKMYWCDQGGYEGEGRIQRANLDGSGVELLFNGSRHPMDVVVDPQRGKIYWSDAGYFEIRRSNLDGLESEVVHGKQVIVNESAPPNQRRIVVGLRDPHGVALDLVAGKVYWTSLGTGYVKAGAPAASRNGKLQRANFDGSDVEDLAEFGPTQAVAITVAGSRHRARRTDL